MRTRFRVKIRENETQNSNLTIAPMDNIVLSAYFETAQCLSMQHKQCINMGNNKKISDECNLNS